MKFLTKKGQKLMEEPEGVETREINFYEEHKNSDEIDNMFHLEHLTNRIRKKKGICDLTQSNRWIMWKSLTRPFERLRLNHRQINKEYLLKIYF